MDKEGKPSYPKFSNHRPAYVYAGRSMEPDVPRLTTRARLYMPRVLLSELVWFGWVGAGVFRDRESILLFRPSMENIEAFKRLSCDSGAEMRKVFYKKDVESHYGEVTLGGLRGSKSLVIGRYRGVTRIIDGGKVVGMKMHVTRAEDVSTTAREIDNWEDISKAITFEIKPPGGTRMWTGGDNVSVEKMKQLLIERLTTIFGMASPEDIIEGKIFDNERKIEKLRRKYDSGGSSEAGEHEAEEGQPGD